MLFRNQDQHKSSIFGDALERIASELDSSNLSSQDPPKVSLDPKDFIGNKNTVIPSTSADSINAKTSSNLLGSDRSPLMFDTDLYDSVVEDSREKTSRLRSEEMKSRKEAQDSFESLSKPSAVEEGDLFNISSSTLSPMSDVEDNTGLIPGYENSIFDSEAFERLNIHKAELKKDVQKEANMDTEISKQSTSNDIVDSLFSKLESTPSSKSTFSERTVDSLYNLISKGKDEI